MKHSAKLLVVAASGLSLAGCLSPQGQPDYTGSGALGGAAVGALIGSTAARPGPGAAIGAAVGAITGGLIGHGMDQEQQSRLQAQSPQTWQRVEQGQPLAVADIKALAKAGVGDDLIISQIRSSRTVYRLGTAEIVDLKNSGVSEKVIDTMIKTPETVPPPPSAPAPQYYYAPPPVYYAPPPVYYVDPFWYGPGWYGPGWGYGHHWHR